MNATALETPTAARLAEPTTVEVRPRYEGSNICTWIGFKHVNYLVEEAVLEHLRRNGLPAGRLYEDHALCTDIVDIDTRILHAFHIDDVAIATVQAEETSRHGALPLAVTLSRAEAPGVPAVKAKVRVSFRVDRRGAEAEPVPAALATATVGRLGRPAPWDVPEIPLDGADPLETLRGQGNVYAWKWRIPYFYCHFTERVQMSGYLRLMEEVVHLFLADRGVSIKTLLDEQAWIPVVPHSRITVLDEAPMEGDLYTLFTVENVFKRFTYTARMDCHRLDGGRLVPVATGRITHGYAVIDSRRDWSLVPFDDRLAGALAGPGAPAAP